MGAAEVRSLTYQQFIESIQEYIDLYPSQYLNIFKIAEQTKEQELLVGTWNVIRQKTGMEYITFSSTECTKPIISYLLYRIQMNKPIENMDSLLFISQYNTPLSQHTFNRIYERINQRAGLGRRNEKRNSLTSHMLRKLFTTILYEEGVDKMKVDWMLGHKINQVSSAYFKTKPDRLKKEYLKLEDKLTLKEVEVRDIAPSQVKDIVHELDGKEARIKELEADQKSMKKTILEMQEDIVRIAQDPEALERLRKQIDK